MQKEIINIEGKELTVYHRNLNMGGHEYVVYNGKLYQKVGSQGAGNKHKICLEKDSTKERIWISTWGNK